MKLKPLLLAGGKSSRMGRPKHLRRLPNNKTLYTHLLEQITESYKDTQEIQKIYISLKDPTASEQLEHETQSDRTDYDSDGFRIEFIYDNPPSSPSPREEENTKATNHKQGNGRPQLSNSNNTPSEIGPASGLLAAYNSDPTSHWLIIACDFPLITAETLQLLQKEFQEPVTCFENEEGFCEPLLSIWSPEALERLKMNVERGKTGPKSTVRDVGGKMIRGCTLDEGRKKWLVGVNTPEEWERAMVMMREDG